MTDRMPARGTLIFLIALLFLTAPVIAATPPVPDFSASRTSGPVPLMVTFQDLSTNSPAGWAWYFGDETYRKPWINQTGSPQWSGREWHSTVSIPDNRNIIVLTGGYDRDHSEVKNDTWFSQDKGATWLQMTAKAQWSIRSEHSVVVLQDKSILLMGGYDDEQGKQVDDLWKSFDNGASWLPVSAGLRWSARSGHSSVVLPDGTIVLTGGYDGNSPTNDTWYSLNNGVTWIKANESSGWEQRSGHSTVAMPDGSIVLIGGLDNDNGNRIYRYLNDVWRSTDYGAHWTLMNASAGWAPRDVFTSVVLPDSSILLMGGNAYPVSMNDVWRSTDNGATWTQVNASADWIGRDGLSSVVVSDGDVVLTGGYSPDGDRNDTWRLPTAGSLLRNPSHTYTTPGTYTVALQVSNSAGYNTLREVGYITVTRPQASGVGVFRPSIHTFLLKNGLATTKVNWGAGTDTPVTGDWNGDGLTDVGVFRNSTHTFYLKNGSITTSQSWGESTDTPVSGDWNGDGLSDIGVFRNSTHTFLLKNGSSTTKVNWGTITDTPVSGDWNGDGLSDIGVFRNSTHTFLLKNGSVTTSINWGTSTDLPVTGDWNGDGLADVGVFRPSTHTFLLKNGSITTSINWGTGTDLPVTGVWS